MRTAIRIRTRRLGTYVRQDFPYPRANQWVNGSLALAPGLGRLGCAQCSSRLGCAACSGKLGDPPDPVDTAPPDTSVTLDPFPVTPVPDAPPASSSSGISISSVVPLINAAANVAGKLIASTKGVTPQVFAAQNPQQQAATQAYLNAQKQQQAAGTSTVGSFFTQQWGPLPAWGWMVGGVVAVSVLKAVRS
jgi:hypothetical protein